MRQSSPEQGGPTLPDRMERTSGYPDGRYRSSFACRASCHHREPPSGSGSRRYPGQRKRGVFASMDQPPQESMIVMVRVGINMRKNPQRCKISRSRGEENGSGRRWQARTSISCRASKERPQSIFFPYRTVAVLEVLQVPVHNVAGGLAVSDLQTQVGRAGRGAIELLHGHGRGLGDHRGLHNNACPSDAGGNHPLAANGATGDGTLHSLAGSIGYNQGFLCHKYVVGSESRDRTGSMGGWRDSNGREMLAAEQYPFCEHLGQGSPKRS